MRQKETNLPRPAFHSYREHYPLLFTVDHCVTGDDGVMVQSAVNAWLKDKSYQIVDITHAIQKRVDTWRYVTWQIYDNIAATTSPPPAKVYKRRA